MGAFVATESLPTAAHWELRMTRRPSTEIVCALGLMRLSQSRTVVTCHRRGSAAECGPKAACLGEVRHVTLTCDVKPQPPHLKLTVLRLSTHYSLLYVLNLGNSARKHKEQEERMAQSLQ